MLMLGKRGAVSFSTQGVAEDYLRALPDMYVGRAFNGESGKWMVSYHRKDLKHTDNCGRTGPASVASCKIGCMCWCHKQDVRK